MDNLDLIASDIRKKIFKTAINAKAGHIASSFSMVEIMTALYFGGVLKCNPQYPNLAERDRFILSKGHGALSLYSTLVKAGFLGEKDLDSFCKPYSNLGCHPNVDEIVGIEASTGALGHGLSFGIGIALAGKLNKIKYNVYVLLGDGECQEGSIWEAALTAGHYKLSNLIVIIDYNKLQGSERLESIATLEPFGKKWQAFGFHVIEADGHNIHELVKAFEYKSEIPKAIIAHTIKGKGISYMENRIDWHSRLPNENEIQQGLFELKMSREELYDL